LIFLIFLIRRPRFFLFPSHLTLTTLGTASNLDLFASEFDFKRQSVKEKFLPKHKDYNLDKAYERCAFLKGKSGFTTICTQMKDHILPTSHAKSLVFRLNISLEIKR
jgi:hypothetical protein